MTAYRNISELSNRRNPIVTLRVVDCPQLGLRCKSECPPTFKDLKLRKFGKKSDIPTLIRYNHYLILFFYLLTQNTKNYGLTALVCY